MQRNRRSGVICHPTSFPGPHGIGDLGEAAFRFVEWLERGSQSDWQVLPLGPVGSGNSPYASPSAFAGNVLLISLPWLAGDGLLDEQRLTSPPDIPTSKVDFDTVRDFKIPLLYEAFSRFRRGAGAKMRPDFDAYRTQNAHWLQDYTLFMALKDANGGAAWVDWPPEIALRDPLAIEAARATYREEQIFHAFCQFLFDRQWSEVHRYARDKGVQIIGDLPIFVAFDSADVWANRSLFRLDSSGHPIEVAGVPPDAFTAEGQLWGNPVYDWASNERSGYSWWIARVGNALKRVDVLRIDHFRGFAASWIVPAGSASAASGHWEVGPGRAIFDAIHGALGSLPFIAEDLGLITRDVTALRKELGFPGMSVLQFAFDSGPSNVYLPHNYDHRVVAYTGTHDNQTTVGWFRGLPEWVRGNVQRYVGRDGSDIAWDFIRLAWSSVADRAIAPLHDVMRLDNDARMNTPGVASGNWEWRFAPYQLHEGSADALRELSETYGRIQSRRAPSGFDPFDYTAPNTDHPLLHGRDDHDPTST